MRGGVARVQTRSRGVVLRVVEDGGERVVVSQLVTHPYNLAPVQNKVLFHWLWYKRKPSVTSCRGLITNLAWYKCRHDPSGPREPLLSANSDYVRQLTLI